MISAIKANKAIKYGVSAVMMGAPAVYMIHFHDKFYTQREDRIKMLNKQLGFWGGFSAGLYIIHKNLRKFKSNKLLLASSAAFMAVAPYIGVRLGKLINKFLFPTKPGEGHNHYQKLQQNHFNKDFDIFLRTTQNTAR